MSPPTPSDRPVTPPVEVIVGEITEPMIGPGMPFDGECSIQFQGAAECFEMMEDGKMPPESEIAEMVERFRKARNELQSGLSSTATAVPSSMASQWISHMKKNFKRRAIALSEDQQGMIKKMVNEHGATDLTIRDILMLYSRGLEAHHDGRYREMFDRLRPCVPYFNTNVLVWIRISEALIYEFYEEVWEFKDVYGRLFEESTPHYEPSPQRVLNEHRKRHPDMNLRFAETATLMTFALAKHSSREPVHWSASALHGFMLLKLKRYEEALDAINFTVDRYYKRIEYKDETAILLTYKAEGLIGVGRFTRAIEYCIWVIDNVDSSRTRHRAQMLCAIAYMRKANYVKAHSFVLEILAGSDILDEKMLESVALLGLNLAHLMGNSELFKRFTALLQNIVY